MLELLFPSKKIPVAVIPRQQDNIRIKEECLFEHLVILTCLKTQKETQSLLLMNLKFIVLLSFYAMAV